mmetsp:Transcript_49616/g.105596  ORF Transcript_49616/g.105596 Transcript_49616/m.105596 type:complete len:264 (+) Transcript_49616:2109-2900(+)
MMTWCSLRRSNNSSLTWYTGNDLRCSSIVLLFANSDCASFFWFLRASPYCPPDLWLKSSSASPSSALLSFFLTPNTLPMADPWSSQKRARNLPESASSRTCFTTLEPCLESTAMSEVGSFRGQTASVCSVYTTRPSKNGGVVSLHCTATRRSSPSLVKSKFTSRRSFRPAWPRRFSSHNSLASFLACCLKLTLVTEAACFFIFSSFSARAFGSIASTIWAAPPSSESYHMRSNLLSSYSSISASAAIFFCISSLVITPSVNPA